MSAVNSHLDPCVRSAAAADRLQVSNAIPCFASITVVDAAANEFSSGTAASAEVLNGCRRSDLLDIQERKGLLFLGTGVSCALPQLAHVLPIAEPSHPFHPFIHMPLEELPSVTTLHELATAHQDRQQQQWARRDGGGNREATPGTADSHAQIEDAQRQRAEEDSRHTGSSFESFAQYRDSDHLNTEKDITAGSNRLRTGITNFSSEDNNRVSSRRQMNCSDGVHGRPCSSSDFSRPATVKERQYSSVESKNKSTSTKESSWSTKKGVHEEGSKTVPICHFRCQVGEGLQEKFYPAPACVSCFMSWKSAGDPNNRGNVCAVLRLGKDKHVLIDCGKTFRQAALSFCPRYGIRSLSGVLLTHDHQDAVGGLDDLRDMQRFCRPPYPKGNVALVVGGTPSGAAAGEEGVSSSIEIQRSSQIAQRGHPEKPDPHPRDTLGYRPCYMLDCFLGVHTYKTLCIRYGYIVDASLRMMSWISETRKRKQMDNHRKLEEGSTLKMERQQEKRQGRVSALHCKETTFSLGTLGGSPGSGEETTKLEEPTLNGKEMDEFTTCDVSVGPQQKKVKVTSLSEKDKKNNSGSEMCMWSACGQDDGITAVHASEQEQLPVRIPCSPEEPDWEKAPVFERKVSCLAFHLLDDEPPRSGGLASTRAPVCSSFLEKKQEPSAVTTTGETGDIQRKEACSSPLCEQTASSTSHIAPPNVRGKGKASEVSLSLPERRKRETATRPTPEEPADACLFEKAAKEDDTRPTYIGWTNTNIQDKTGNGGKEAEETAGDNSCLSTSTSITTTRADAAGFCEVRIPGTNTKLVSFPVFHGGSYVCLGYVIGSEEKLVYMSDVKGVPSPVLQKLKSIGDLHTLVIDALSEKLHGSHFSIQEALTVAVELQPREVYLVGMTCTLEHNQTNRRLRCWLLRHQELYRSLHGGRESRLSHVALAFDGQFLSINF